MLRMMGHVNVSRRRVARVLKQQEEKRKSAAYVKKMSFVDEPKDTKKEKVVEVPSYMRASAATSTRRNSTARSGARGSFRMSALQGSPTRSDKEDDDEDDNVRGSMRGSMRGGKSPGSKGKAGKVKNWSHGIGLIITP